MGALPNENRASGPPAPGDTPHVPAPTKTDRRNAFLYCKFRDRQFALYDAFAKRNGLLMKTFLVLNALYYAEGGMAQSEICARTFQSKQTVNLIVKNLLRDGHAAKVADPQDRRSKLVRLTKAGRAYAKGPVTHITWAEDAAMALFSPEEQEQLISLSRRFTQNLADLVNGTYGEDPNRAGNGPEDESEDDR